jgi:hypothetical protein
MSSDPLIQRCRSWYAKLLCLYPKTHRERFGEGMQQTFNDLCRERVEQGSFGFILWILADTSAAIVRENLAFISMQTITRRLITWAALVALILLVPLLGNQFIDGWNWDLFDFVFAGLFLFGAAVTYELLLRKWRDNTAYRAAVGLAVVTGIILLWVNAAVGIIGDGPVNLMYLGVPALGLIGAIIAHLDPRGMARSLCAVALAQMLVPVLARVIWNPPFNPGVAPVFLLNGVFATLWIGSALLFRRADAKRQMAHPPGV